MRILYIIAVILVIFWVIGLVFEILGNFIHLFLVVAVALVLLRLIRGPRR